MYAIQKDGDIIAFCDKPRYVKLNDNGIYVKAHQNDAIALSINGTLYNIEGKSAILDAPEVSVFECEEAEVIFQSQVKLHETSEAIAQVEDALCELEIGAENQLAILENALCELDSTINNLRGDDINE